VELWYAPRHSLRSCPRRDFIGSTAAERSPLGSPSIVPMRSLRTRFLVSVCSLTLSHSSALAQSASNPRFEIAGCYTLTLGRWSRPLGVNGEYHQLPLRIDLDTASAAQGGWKLRPDLVFPGGNQFAGTPRWTATVDSVELLWSNGYQPTWVRLARRSVDQLQGEAIVGSDANEFGNDPPRAPVTARRRSCR